MKERARIFLADPSPELRTLLRGALEEEPDLCLWGEAGRGDVAYALMEREQPEVLVTELLLPGLDGLSLLRRMKDEGRLPPTLVISGFVNTEMAQAVSRLGAAGFLPKPFALSELVYRIRETAAGTGRRRAHEDEAEIKKALRALCLDSALQGYRYLLGAVEAALEDRNMLRGVTKILYPELARRYDTNPSCVEHSIRCAVGRAWERSTPESRRAEFGPLFDGYKKAPGNAKFIAALADHIDLTRAESDVWRSAAR